MMQKHIDKTFEQVEDVNVTQRRHKYVLLKILDCQENNIEDIDLYKEKETIKHIFMEKEGKPIQVINAHDTETIVIDEYSC